MTFHQENWQLQGSKVYNITGDLHLTEQSGTAEFVAALNELRSKVQELTDLPTEERRELDQDLAAADPTADTDGVDATDGDAVSGRLTRIAHRLRALGGTATAALELGTAVDSLAQYAGQHL
ncbi:hypothetical protein CW362_35785 [Streptomyces populi]|uniref:Uncharacterized protein n=1 Tax=Streptomyces populi TaxID=2058924 RepID=A0A2I0SEC0_9ACTN|nr:hypothetical protein [Streptomyces populi]PKT68285.1 hypothetical protein CW362_35785 [Streptomyces populi]